MKAVVCKDQRLTVEERPDPVPETAQLLVKVLRCGICGSDLHVRQHCDHWGKPKRFTGSGHASPYADWKAPGFQNNIPGLLELALSSKEQLDKLPLPWLAEGEVDAAPLITGTVGLHGVDEAFGTLNT